MSSNLRKSLTITYKEHKGTKIYYDILVENESKPKCCIKWNSTLKTILYLFFNTGSKTEAVSDTFSSEDSRYKHYVKKNESQTTRNVPLVTDTVKIFPICFGDVILYNIFVNV